MITEWSCLTLSKMPQKPQLSFSQLLLLHKALHTNQVPWQRVIFSNELLLLARFSPFPNTDPLGKYALASEFRAVQYPWAVCTTELNSRAIQKTIKKMQHVGSPLLRQLTANICQHSEIKHAVALQCVIGFIRAPLQCRFYSLPVLLSKHNNWRIQSIKTNEFILTNTVGDSPGELSPLRSFNLPSECSCVQADWLTICSLAWLLPGRDCSSLLRFLYRFVSLCIRLRGRDRTASQQ